MTNRWLAVIGLLAIGICVKAGSIAMAIWLEAAFPSFMRRGLNAYESRPRRCAILGFVNFVSMALICIVLLQTKVLALIGLLGIGVLITFVIVGYSLAYRNLGVRAFPGLDRDAPLYPVLYGGVIAEVAFVAPVIGQVFSIAVLFRGLGAAVSALLNRRELLPPLPDDPA